MERLLEIGQQIRRLFQSHMEANQQAFARPMLRESSKKGLTGLVTPPQL